MAENNIESPLGELRLIDSDNSDAESISTQRSNFCNEKNWKPVKEFPSEVEL